jgi:2-amino-4-hydroxy-6-hydroxymethyldihydropteridine diphosphokinase
MRAGIALGSNLEDRLQCLQLARTHLRALHLEGAPFLCSRIYETAAEDCLPGSPAFLNAAIELSTTLPPLDFLMKLQEIEECLGRPRSHGYHEPRTIDLDLLFFDNLVLHLPELELPHPRIASRSFVLKPLSDICPRRMLPGSKACIEDLLKSLPSSSVARAVSTFSN